MTAPNASDAISVEQAVDILIKEHGQGAYGQARLGGRSAKTNKDRKMQRYWNQVAVKIATVQVGR